ncbi:hypothetical protein PSHT_07412 [Puccinia striiformis]|uniref:Uncharacterized protein n=1 Tax=Puccinia striiformis TaxID=27350 RepID=A0A2S4VXX5_9BASI|nr:hypothetical protein PSHT_07412 [Puccinia striiformis]
MPYPMSLEPWNPYGDEYDCFNHILANQRASLREEHVGEVVERIFQPINVSLTANDICGNSQPWSRAPVFVGSCTSNGECNVEIVFVLI